MMIISVVIPVYNAERYLQQSVNSVLSQNYDNIELICIDDGSTDNTAGLLADIKDRTKIPFRIISQKNKGVH